MAEEKKEAKTFVPMRTADLMKQENFMKSLNAAIEGMKAFDEKKANNMYQNLDNNVITRPVEIRLNKDGGIDMKDVKKGEQPLMKHKRIGLQNAVNLMHTQLQCKSKENPVFFSEATMKSGFLKAKKDVEPTFVVSLDNSTGKYYERKMYHISQVEVDQKALDRKNEGRSKKLSAINLDDIAVKVDKHERRYTDEIRKSIAHFVETEGNGKIANLDNKKLAEKILGYAIQQRSEERFTDMVAMTIKAETAGIGPKAAAAFQKDYPEQLRPQLFAKDDKGNHIKQKEAEKLVHDFVAKYKDKTDIKTEEKAEVKAAEPKKEKKAKKKEVPAR